MIWVTYLYIIRRSTQKFKSVLLCHFVTLHPEFETIKSYSVDGTQRNMLVYAPADLPENAPLLISLHGMNQDAPYQQNMANWEAGMPEK